MRQEEEAQEREDESLPEGAIRRVRMGHLFGREEAEEEEAPALPPPSQDVDIPEGKSSEETSRNEPIFQALTVLALALSMGKPSLFVIGGLLAFLVQKYALRRVSWPFFIACMLAALFAR